MGESSVEYVVDWRPWGHDLGADALRICLRLLEDAVSEFECDIPDADSSSTEVAQAAATLRGVARWPNRHPAATGVLKAGDALVWDAFVTFAPHALDGSVWTRGDGRPVVSFADQGTSVVVRLDSAEAERLAERVAPALLVPVEEWRRRSRQDGA
jgi:hypothetical protein